MNLKYKIKKTLIVAMGSMFLFTSNSCSDYLDIVPEDITTLDDAFKTPGAALNFLYSVYGYMPRENDMFDAIGLWGTDEIVTPWDRSWYYAKRLMKGELNSSDPFFDYWTSSGDIDMYDGIRQAYIFLNNIDKAPDFTAAEVRRMKGEATFLIAYYHFILLRQYGPIALIDSEISLDAEGEEFYPERRPYDECVDFIAAKFDEATTLLPTNVSSSRELGRINKSIAKAVKARMLLYAASPLFNGNAEFYADFKNVDGVEQMISTSYDENKWVLAANANKDAIDTALGVGHDLFESTITGATEAEQGTLNYRYSMVEPWNNEVIWGYSIAEPYYGWQRHSMPRVDGLAYNGQACSLSMVETFYTENGLPIDVDPNYDAYYAGNKLVLAADGIPVLHHNREPRFNAVVGYDRGVFEVNEINQVLYMRQGEANGWTTGSANYSPTGYLVKKGVHPQSTITQSNTSLIRYPWPLVRLAELYLNYAEALNEAYGTARHVEVIQYLDLVRERSKIPGVLASWALVGKTAFTKDEMRAIIQQERNIELCYEGHRVWDVRRWKQGDTYFNTNAEGLSIQESAAADFYTITDAEVRVFESPRDYLFPIRINELEKNTNLVQNPNW
ncbi:MAG: RagB/SusD family nutrient uptake outer membrane protein [Flavobacteriaceae bacterium]